MVYLRTSPEGPVMKPVLLIAAGIILGWWAHSAQLRYERQQRQAEFDEVFARLRHPSHKTTSRKDGSK